jgi:CDP-4-dehydro-6-deoxyglucose reductase, E1
MKGRNFRTVGSLENADIVVDRTFWIGVYPGLGRTQLDYMLDVFTEFAASHAQVDA